MSTLIEKLTSRSRVRWLGRLRRRGVMVLVAAVLLVAVFAFVGLSVDTGHVVYQQTSLQNAVDAAALAASQEITGAVHDAGEGHGDATIDANSIAVAAARDMASQVAALNGIYIDPVRDVQFGKRTYDEATGTWPIEWGAQPYNVVSVTAHRDNPDSAQPDARVRLHFGWALGRPTVDLQASAAAFVEARDIVLVMDYSGSMSYDSQFRSDTLSKLGQAAVESNLREIWQDLGSPTYGNLAFAPNYVTVSKPSGTVKWTGKTVQVTFGQVAANVKLTFTNNATQTFSGGSVGQVVTLNGTGTNNNKQVSKAQIKVGTAWTTYDFYDTTTVKQALGLNSVTYPYPQGSWNDYITYCRNVTSGTSFYDSQLDATGYRCKFGMMTMMDFWMKHYRQHDETTDLWKTRHYPFHAIKEGATLFCDFLSDLEFGDYLGLVTYDTTSRIETVLDESGMPYVDINSHPITNDYASVNTIQRHKQAAHYAPTTNIGGGLDSAIALLNNHRRYGARPTILLMTDGNANVRDPNWSLPAHWNWNELTDYNGDGTADYTTTDECMLYAFGKAKEAVDQGFTIHTMSVGAEADRDMMKAIAFMGGGIWIDIPGGTTVATMEEQLLAAFRQIAANVPPAKLVYPQ
jgi:Flp pilus assembly protein TadG